MQALECFLLRRSEKIVDNFLLYLDPPDLVVLSQLNVRLRYWFYCYRARAWDFVDFARLYVYRPRALLSHIDGKNSMMYGYSILRFLLRCANGFAPLDICANLAKFSVIQEFLEEEGYTCSGLYPDYGWTTVDDKIGALIRRTHNMDSWTWSFSRDRSNRLEDLRGYVFKFGKGFARNRRRINVYLIRCEPYRHVLSSPLSKWLECFSYLTVLNGDSFSASYTCYMTAFKVVAPFPNSTFRHKKAFALEGQTDPRIAIPGNGVLIQGKGMNHSIEIVRGPPHRYDHFRCAETGLRSYEDGKCWIMMRESYGA